MQKFKVISFSYQYFSFLLVSTRNFTFAKVVFECHLKTKKTPKNQKPNPTPKQNTVQWLWSCGLPTLPWLRLSLHRCCPSPHHPWRHESLEKQSQHDRSAERLEGRGSAAADEFMALLLYWIFVLWENHLWHEISEHLWKQLSCFWKTCFLLDWA